MCQKNEIQYDDDMITNDIEYALQSFFFPRIEK